MFNVCHFIYALVVYSRVVLFYITSCKNDCVTNVCICFVDYGTPSVCLTFEFQWVLGPALVLNQALTRLLVVVSGWTQTSSEFPAAT